MDKQKILACDIDGTIIKHYHGKDKPRSVLAEDKLAIENYVNSDNIFIFSTGRDILGTLKFLKNEQFNLKNYYLITSNGAQIYDKNNVCIYKKTLTNKIVNQIINVYNKVDNKYLDISLFDGTRTYSLNHENNDKNIDLSNIINIEISSNRKCENDVQNIYLQIKNNTEYNVTLNTWYVDIIPLNSSKGMAINYICNLQDKDDLIIGSIGDSWNDLSMFECSKYSYTFTTSPQEIQSIVTCTYDYLYECISDFLLR